MRRRIYEIIQISKPGDRGSLIYDYVMIVTMVLSLIPLAFKESNPVFYVMDKTAAGIFVADYLLRLATADLKLKRGRKSFFLYPFTGWAIVDLLSILPSFKMVSSSFKMLKMLKLLRLLRVISLFRNSRSVRMILTVLHMQRNLLLAVGGIAVGYIVASALVIFNVESVTFQTFFDAVYWATVSLTTMGYGDIYPVTAIGRVVTMISSFLGIAIVALPTGILTAGFLREHEKNYGPSPVSGGEP